MAVTNVFIRRIEEMLEGDQRMATLAGTLTDDAPETWATGLTSVAKCFPAIVSNAGVAAASSILCLPSGTAGAVDVTAVGANGTTTLAVIAIGY